MSKGKSKNKNQIMLSADMLPAEKKCACCGKKFCRISWDIYIYKDGAKVYCSYGCMRRSHTQARIVKKQACSD